MITPIWVNSSLNSLCKGDDSHMEVRLILAANDRGVIGDKGHLLWHIRGDLNRFKRLTMYHPVIMGRKTYESLPNNNLPDRDMYVCSKRHFWKDSVERCVEHISFMNGTDASFSNLEPKQLITHIANTSKYKESECIWVIGGAEIYKLYAPYANKIYLTHVLDLKDGDTKFDDSILKDFKLVFQGCPLEEGGYTYRYLVFERDK